MAGEITDVEGLPEYRWEPEVSPGGRYRNIKTGRFVSAGEVIGAVDIRITESANIMTGLSHDLANGKINLAQWQKAMAKEIETANLLSGSIGAGGVNNLTAADRLLIEKQTREQLKYLQKFAKQIETGKVPLFKTDGTINGNLIDRAKRYALSSKQSKSIVENNRAKENGNTEVMRILGAADHCKECPPLAGKWVKIGQNVPIGATICGGYCHCREKYR